MIESRVVSAENIYNSAGRLKTLNTWKQPPIPYIFYQNLTYAYDGKGNIATITDTQNSITHNYTYDALDRLDTATGTGTNPYSQDYNYDRIGNITYKSDAGTYIYDYGNKPHAVKTVISNSTIYNDAQVNIIYNYDQKPECIQRNFVDYVRFYYDGNGQRVRKYNYSTGQTTLYFGEGYEIRNGVETLHLFAGSRRVASIRTTDGKNQFYHPNHLGSASVITDSSGNRKEQIEYYPFGTERAPGSPQGTYDYDGSFPDVFYTFTDQEVDDDTGFYNYGARLYDPLLGRFISPDRLVPDPGNPQALNRYAYCLNNPLIYTDPSGEFIESIIAAIVSIVTSEAFLTAAAYVVGGAALGAATSAATGGNIWQGALTGAISGAIFFGAGEIIGAAANVGQLTTVAERVAVHAVAGMFAGGINSAITGGNIGLGILTGGISGGLGMAVGNLNFIPKDFTSQLLARSLAGGIAGGITAEIYGGKFGEGFALGASTAAAGFLFNHYIHWVRTRDGQVVPMVRDPKTGTLKFVGTYKDPLTEYADNFINDVAIPALPYAAGGAVTLATGNAKLGLMVYGWTSTLTGLLFDQPAGIPLLGVRRVNPIINPPEAW
jgi:RHS repeat-associated protein